MTKSNTCNALRVFCFIFILFTLNSCRKSLTDLDSNQIRNEFFNENNTQSNELKKIISQIKIQDSLNNFIPQLVNKIGYPQWNKSVTNEANSNNQTGRINSSDSIIFFVPFKKVSSPEVLGYLTCLKINDSLYRFRIFSKAVLDTMTNIPQGQKEFYKNASSLFALFEKSINNVDSVYIAGSFNTFFSKTKISFSNSNQSDSNSTGRTSWSAYSVQTCYVVKCDNSQSRTSISEQKCYQCSTTWYFDWTEPTQITNWWEGYNSGGGGSGSYEIIPDPSILGNFIDDPSVFEDDPMQVTFDYDQHPWPTISNILSTSQFVEYDHRNCLALAQDQIAKAGLRDLGYGSSFKVYDANGGPYPSVAKFGINYIMTKLQSGKPVIVGVDNRLGTPSSVNADGKTDHFVTIVGSGQDSRGKYLTFYDNASNLTIKGCSSNNKLYYDESTGKITGYSAANGAPPTYYDYIVTQIRKNQ
jgi:hypothetical protein